MPIRLKTDDLEFVRRVHALTGGGRTQSQIAAAMGMSLTGLRSKLARFSFGFENRFDCEVIRLGSRERLQQLLDSGEVVEQPAEEEAVAA